MEGRDSGIFSNDSIEIFIDPFLSRKKYYHLGSNIIGSRLDQERADLGSERGWDPDWTVKTFKSESFWTAEISIPFACFKMKAPAKNAVWGLNLCRDYAPAKEYGSWSCTYGSFHTPLLFGQLVFE